MLCQSFQGPDATNENSPDWPTHTFTISRADLGDGEGGLRGGGGIQWNLRFHTSIFPLALYLDCFTLH